MMYRGQALVFACVLILFTCAACDVREDLPTVEQALPAGFEEKTVPQEFVDEMFKARRDTGWIRCFDVDMDWQELNRSMATSLQSLGYTDHTSEWLPVFFNNSGLPEEDCRQCLKVYSSQSDFGHVLVFHLAYFRKYGSITLGTSGDYLAMCGYDNTTKKQALGPD